MTEEDRVCAICFGPMGKRPGDICCKDEDNYLLIAAKGAIRESEDRSIIIEDLVERVFESLADFLCNKGEFIEDYDEGGVLGELERRVLRWVKKEMITVNSVKGIAFCAQCGYPVMAGRTLCGRCAEGRGMSGSTGSPQPSAAPAAPRGMHVKRS